MSDTSNPPNDPPAPATVTLVLCDDDRELARQMLSSLARICDGLEDLVFAINAVTDRATERATRDVGERL